MTTILIVDDELDILVTLHLVLSLAGYAVTTASDGAEGLRRISENRPDLVICDMTMPELDGPQMCAYLRSDPRTRNIPIILTSSAEPAPQLEQNWDTFMPKPSDVPALLDEIKRLLPQADPSGARVTGPPS